jgi:hypothetical protein
MITDRTKLPELIEAAGACLGQERVPLLQQIATSGAIDFDWYLEEKIVGVADPDEQRDNERVLKYAFNFGLSGAKVTFVRELPHRRTPDILVVIPSFNKSINVEVRKFRLHGGSTPHRELKILDAIVSKRNQLPHGELGVVAIDNFDIGLEPALTHTHISEAFEEADRLATDNPPGWERPGAVVVAPCTPGRISSATFPHFVWINRCGKPLLNPQVGSWLASSLPDGRIIKNHEG